NCGRTGTEEVAYEDRRKRKGAARHDEIRNVLAGRDFEWNAARVDERQRSHEIGPRACDMNRNMSTHRISNEVHRLANRLFDPTGEQRCDQIKSERQLASAQKQTVTAESDQVDRHYAIFARERTDVVSPPIRRAAQAVDQDDRN